MPSKGVFLLRVFFLSTASVMVRSVLTWSSSWKSGDPTGRIKKDVQLCFTNAYRNARVCIPMLYAVIKIVLRRVTEEWKFGSRINDRMVVRKTL
jgi:hypothetical protein